MKTKVIIKPCIARTLFKMNNNLVDFKPNKNNPLETVFVFEDTEKLRQDLKFITTK